MNTLTTCILCLLPIFLLDFHAEPVPARMANLIAMEEDTVRAHFTDVNLTPSQTEVEVFLIADEFEDVVTMSFTLMWPRCFTQYGSLINVHPAINNFTTSMDLLSEGKLSCLWIDNSFTGITLNAGDTILGLALDVSGIPCKNQQVNLTTDPTLIRFTSLESTYPHRVDAGQMEVPAVDPVICDSLILADWHESLSGTNMPIWDLAQPMDTWNGIMLTPARRVFRIEVTGAQLMGELPCTFGDLDLLDGIDLSENQLSGSLPIELTELSHLEYLLLRLNTLEGNLPTGWGNLQKLEALDLSSNSFDGEIPKSLWHAHELIDLELNNNDLSGEIPVDLDSLLPNLEALILGSNDLHGTIPTSLTSMNLGVLDLSNNRLRGQLPDSIGKLTQLEDLFLQENDLSGLIPPSLGNCTGLVNLNISGNQLTGEIPKEIGALLVLNELNASDNLIYGCFTQELSSLCNIPIVDFSGNVGLPGNGDFQSYCSSGAGLCTSCHPDKPSLKAFYQATNGWQWDNQWDTSTCNICDWYGILCNQDGRVISIDMDDVDDDTISFANQDGNLLSGYLPDEIGEFPYLERLILSKNSRVSGNLPYTIGQLTNLQILSIGHPAVIFGGWNPLSGSIPDAFSNMTQLQYFDLSGNQFIGSIPSSIYDLVNLKTLLLGDNDLTGIVSPNIANLSNLELIGIWDTEMAGEIPSSISGLHSIREIYLQNNHFTGPPPRALAYLNNLTYLNLANNDLTGCIPDEWSSLCGREIYLQNNPQLPLGGDFAAFCLDGTGSCVGACDDGILNRDEENRDCGGAYCPSCDSCTIVSTVGGNGPGSLRNAVSCASAGDTITFDIDLVNATIDLSSPAILIDKLLYIVAPTSSNIMVSNLDLGDQEVLVSISDQLFIEGLTLAGQSTESFVFSIEEGGSLEVRDVGMDRIDLQRN